MGLTKEQIEKFESLAKPLIKFLCENCNPHTMIVIETTSAEILSGEAAIVTDEYVLD